MTPVSQVRVPSFHIVEGDDEPVVVTVLQTLWTRRMTLYEADDARDGGAKSSDGRPQGLLDRDTASALPGHENDMGYLAHAAMLGAGRCG